jgi:hypothetical protein
MFGETFSLLACAGMALTVAAVALVVRAPDMPAAALQQAQKLR